MTHIVLAPDMALALSKAKTATGSNQSLLETVDDGIKLAGLIALISPAVHRWQRLGAGLLAGDDRSPQGHHGHHVHRCRVRSDATQIRAVSRVGFGFANPAGIVRLHDAADLNPYG
ncbi:hypothetical protein SIM91_02795 [Rhodococcus opacus]|uniref:hypothetical protein n=1 Tax=Rhodococcus opacus TaxID=37919 RepID=UPI000A89A48D|nr:hypothetical protein [Rhodococcus opacus]MDX5962270.1 hypothetical protein [Rhodococcus opacus]CAG7641843.1 hypothetical protein E143388_08326 [Rhodococcus opacus]